MSSYTNKDGENVGKYFVIQKSISVTFEGAGKPPDNLQVQFEDWDGDVMLSLSNPEKANNLDQTRCWALDREILLFPDDTLSLKLLIDKKSKVNVLKVLKVLLGKKGKESTFDQRQINYRDIKNEFVQHGHVNTPVAICLTKDHYTITLDVLEGNINRIIENASNDDLNPLLPERVQNVIESANSLLNNARSLQRILEKIPMGEEALQFLESALDEIGDIHPLAKAVVTALTIPYKWLKNEADYKKDMEDTARVMLFTCKCLMEVRYHVETDLAKDTFKNSLKLLRNISVFIGVYCGKNRFKQLFKAQFPKELREYTKRLDEQKDDFVTAMILQIARDDAGIKYETSESFLLNRLKPAVQQKLGEGCFPNTREDTLNEVRTWREAPNSSSKKVLWVVGAPGTGKSTIATTIFKDDNLCVKFFATRGSTELREPGRVWPSIAYDLACSHNGLRAVIMHALEEKKNMDFRNYSASQQLQQLIKEPLEKYSKETSHTLANTCPVVIIDALDELKTGEDLASLLDSFKEWPSEAKLLITSRDFDNIRRRLGEAIHVVDLADSNGESDVKVFFEAKFEKRKFMPEYKDITFPKVWPDEKAIQDLTNYASGLFVWAEMVINYVVPADPRGAYDPSDRLEKVLRDVRENLRDQPNMKLENRVDVLYARIIYDALQKTDEEEKKKARSILASILLAKVPLREEDLIEIAQSNETTQDPAISAHNRVKTTLSNLRPIIPASDKEVRVFHQTVSDYALSFERSSDALKNLVKDEAERRTYIIDIKEENLRFGLACLRLMCRDTAETLLKRLQTRPSSFSYSWDHWAEHLEDANKTDVCYRTFEKMTNLAGAMKVAYRSLKNFEEDIKLVNDEAVALIRSIRDAPGFATRCIDAIKNGTNFCSFQRDIRLPTTEHADAEVLRQDLNEYTLNLGIARGNFQKVAVLRKVSGAAEISSKAAEHFLHERLGPSDQPDFDEECALGTRTDIFSDAKEWLKDPNASRILWIVGAPGAGKSTVATTLLKKEFSGICAKFFAKRDFADRRDPSRFWRTLIYDFATLHDGLRGSIMEALLLKSLSGSKDQGEQRSLLFDAIKEQQCLPVVAVFDALDECVDENLEEWGELLRTVSGRAESPRSFKLVVTSRDLPDIRSALSNVSREVLLATGSKATSQIKTDLEMFFRRELADPSLRHWLSGDVLPQLVEHAAGSFIWAKVVVGLLKLNPNGRPEDILVDGSAVTGDVDVLYGKVLLQTLGQLSADEREYARTVLSAIVLAKDQLHMSFIESLPLCSEALSKDKVRQLMKDLTDELSVIITVDTDTKHLRIPQKAFADFFLNTDRCLRALELLKVPDQERHLYSIHQGNDSGILAVTCLRWIISNSVEPTTQPTVQTSQLGSENVNNKSPPSLIYASKYWGKHLRSASDTVTFYNQARPLLDTLVHKSTLSWIDVLRNVHSPNLDAISLAQESLASAKNMLESHGIGWAEVGDAAHSFVGSLRGSITAAVLHIGISDLKIHLPKTRVHQIYGPRTPVLLSVAKRGRDSGINEDSDARVSMRHSGHNGVILLGNITISRNGKWVASSSVDKTVHVWDYTSSSGKAITPPLEHTSSVTSIAASPVSCFLACGSADGTLYVWDMNAVKLFFKTKAHHGVINSIAYSADANYIVTVSSYYRRSKVQVWVASTLQGNQVSVGELETLDDSDIIKTVAFSPDGKRIVTGSVDGKIQILIWDTATLQLLGKPLDGQRDSINCVEVSRDGRNFISGSTDKRICSWNMATGAILSSYLTGSTVYSVSYSPDGKVLVSGHHDGSIGVWNTEHGLHRVGDFYGHTGAVRSVAFSLDGRSFASGSEDESIRTWNTPSTYIPTRLVVHVNEGQKQPNYSMVNPTLVAKSYRKFQGKMSSCGCRKRIGHTSASLSLNAST
ncbi:WD40 repeat-like protein [Schizopora paradoxa]|uniref:WD40 repeat-like protein n=1 Tax=Schizopora paradoxa TaxID=27342 RepID=A0A0H2R2Y3_9AGAM|nr:WD40 repeat-like protein [Schizopora paradoxa]